LEADSRNARPEYRLGTKSGLVRELSLRLRSALIVVLLLYERKLFLRSLALLNAGGVGGRGRDRCDPHRNNQAEEGERRSDPPSGASLAGYCSSGSGHGDPRGSSTLNGWPAPTGLADGLALETKRYRRTTAGFAPTDWVPRSPPRHDGDSAPTPTRAAGGELRNRSAR